MLQRIHLHTPSPQPLWNASSSKAIEQQALAIPQNPSLMERAGRSVAQLARAIAPHAHQAWVLCGPGNNGGDGLVAARHLAESGWRVFVHWLGQPETCSADTRRAWQIAQQSAVHWLPLTATPDLGTNDIWIDALLGLGQRAKSQQAPCPITELLTRAYASPAHALAVDVPTGLDCSSGCWLPGFAPNTGMQAASRHTLSLLTLKTGLFTADGRDACGTIWWDDLDCPSTLAQYPAHAWLSASPGTLQRLHNSHKGSFGDVLVIGGAAGMPGAAILAAQAALHHGAGRSLLHLIAPATGTASTVLPDIMLPSAEQTHALLSSACVVCGCGGGTAIHAWLPQVLEHAPRLVLDADALNAIASDSALQAQLQQRTTRNQATVLTPHPLEAARLLHTSTAAVQRDRLQAAQSLAQRFACTVLLKGSGSIIASPGHTPHINPTGNARLAIGGTGDVLAGMLAARWQAPKSAHTVAIEAAWGHGALADFWPPTQALTASQLAQAQLPQRSTQIKK